MRIGLIGLGRIGAFHAGILSTIAAIDSLVVTDLDVVAGKRPSPCTVADAIEAGWIAEACARSVDQHRPVRIEEVRIS